MWTKAAWTESPRVHRAPRPVHRLLPEGKQLCVRAPRGPQPAPESVTGSCVIPRPAKAGAKVNYEQTRPHERHVLRAHLGSSVAAAATSAPGAPGKGRCQVHAGRDSPYPEPKKLAKPRAAAVGGAGLTSPPGQDGRHSPRPPWSKLFASSFQEMGSLSSLRESTGPAPVSSSHEGGADGRHLGPQP